jgi:hypothetical protein
MNCREAKLNDQLKLLIELQEIDSSILALVEKIDAIPLELEKFKAPLRKARDAFEKFQKQAEALEKKKKDKDIELDEMQDKIDKLKARSSEIKTNKEYEAHLKEIERFEQKRLQIEDDLLSIMEELESFAEETKKEEEKVKQAEKEFQEQENRLAEEKGRFETELESLKSRRKEFASGLDQELYNQYKTLLKRLGGLAVVETRNEVCMGCNTNIPPQLYNEIRETDNIYTCYYCKRFLYYKEPVRTESPPEQSSAGS